MKTLNKSMVLKDEVILTLLSKLIPFAQLKRVDDFEFTISINAQKFSLATYRSEIIKNLVLICGLNFWKMEDFVIDENNTTHLNSEINPMLNISIDTYIISSSERIITLEVIVYQNEINLYFDSSVIKKEN
jgi:hypothetical protein